VDDRRWASIKRNRCMHVPQSTSYNPTGLRVPYLLQEAGLDDRRWASMNCNP
jgi:hypothetical protein